MLGSFLQNHISTCKQKTGSLVWWHTTNPSTWEAEAGGLLPPRRYTGLCNKTQSQEEKKSKTQVPSSFAVCVVCMMGAQNRGRLGEEEFDSEHGGWFFSASALADWSQFCNCSLQSGISFSK